MSNNAMGENNESLNIKTNTLYVNELSHDEKSKNAVSKDDLEKKFKTLGTKFTHFIKSNHHKGAQ